VRKSRLFAGRLKSRSGPRAAGWPDPSAAVARHRRRLRQASARQEKSAPDNVFFRDPRLAKVEATLFLAREPLTTRKLAQLAGLADGTEARTLIRRLNRLYDGSGSAFRAEEVGGGFQLMSRARFGSWMRRLYQSPIETRLSAAALETLAIVAYRQPVLRAEIDALRGVDCSEILRQLMERDLVRISGRSPELGRPYYYGTTKRFLQVFGLRNLDDLPRAADLRRAATLAATSSRVAAADPR
jgi:segregation and condensation protein B